MFELYHIKIVLSIYFEKKVRYLFFKF
jgi:hypothetical protein